MLESRLKKSDELVKKQNLELNALKAIVDEKSDVEENLLQDAERLREQVTVGTLARLGFESGPCHDVAPLSSGS